MTMATSALDRILQDAAHQHFRAQVDGLCERLTGKMRAYDRVKQDTPEVTMKGALPAQEWSRAVTRTALHSGLIGEIGGLRQALCLLLGYDPDTDAGHEGPADQYAMEWWDRHRPHVEWDAVDE